MEPEAYGHEAIDLVVLDSSYELYYRGEQALCVGAPSPHVYAMCYDQFI